MHDWSDYMELGFAVRKFPSSRDKKRVTSSRHIMQFFKNHAPSPPPRAFLTRMIWVIPWPSFKHYQYSVGVGLSRFLENFTKFECWRKRIVRIIVSGIRGTKNKISRSFRECTQKKWQFRIIFIMRSCKNGYMPSGNIQSWLVVTSPPPPPHLGGSQFLYSISHLDPLSLSPIPIPTTPWKGDFSLQKSAVYIYNTYILYIVYTLYIYNLYISF